MDDINNVDIVVVNENDISEVDDTLVVVFRKPYSFEGVEHTGVDLSGLDNLTGLQYVQISNQINKTNPEVPVQEISPVFAVKIATAITGLPVEFFHMLPANELIKIKNRISRYFFED